MTATPHLSEIDALKATLDALRPLSAEQIRGLATVFDAPDGVGPPTVAFDYSAWD